MAEPRRQGTRVEIYLNGTPRIIASLSGVGAIPPIDALINIRKRTYRVVRTAWAVDHAGDGSMRELRANIDVEEVSDG